MYFFFHPNRFGGAESRSRVGWSDLPRMLPYTSHAFPSHADHSVLPSNFLSARVFLSVTPALVRPSPDFPFFFVVLLERFFESLSTPTFPCTSTLPFSKNDTPPPKSRKTHERQEDKCSVDRAGLRTVSGLFFSSTHRLCG